MPLNVNVVGKSMTKVFMVSNYDIYCEIYIYICGNDCAEQSDQWNTIEQTDQKVLPKNSPQH